MAFSNCPFADDSASLRSPNYTPGRTVNGVTYKIDTITLHMVVGHLSLASLAKVFQGTRQASSNYGIDDKGNVGLFVEEKNRSWCSNSRVNDARAITVEINSDLTAPYAMKDASLKGAIKLCVDICKRNGINKMIWINDKDKALARQNELAEGEGIFTVHRWFADTSCPGQWLMERMQTVCDEVNTQLADIKVGDTVLMEVTEIKDGWAYGKTKVYEPDPQKIVVGSKVTINPGAKVGGLTSKRGKLVDPNFANGKYVDTVDKIEVHKGVEEGRLVGIKTWVALTSLTLVS